MYFKNKLFIIALVFFCNICKGQKPTLKFSVQNPTDKLVIDSLVGTQKYENRKAIETKIVELQSSLYKKGFINATITEKPKPNDSTFDYEIALKNSFKKVVIYIGTNFDFLPNQFSINKAQATTINLSEVDYFLQNISNNLEKQGYSQARVNLANFEIKTNQLFADLKVDLGTKRILNDIVIIGYDKFPQGIKKNMLRQFRTKTFSSENLDKIQTAFDNLAFVSQPKPPEILFTKDTTKVYVYLQKNNANRFDGLVGFANDKNAKLVFNGYLDLLLVNTVNAGERFRLNWKSDGNRQTTFSSDLEIPYLFKTKLVLNAGINIFKQDSIFQNTRTNANLGYMLQQNKRIFVGIETTESTGIQANNPVPSFKSSFTTLQFQYHKLTNRNRSYFKLIPEKSNLTLKTAIGNRQAIDQKNTQQYYTAFAMHNFELNQKLIVNLRLQNYYLQSNTFFVNELYRFGGINSVRGFNENSLQANLSMSCLTEFRYVVSPSLYVHSVADVSYFEDESTAKSGTLAGFGIGFGLLTKSGLLNMVYVNGSSLGQQANLGNSIVHLSLKVDF